MQTLTDYGVRNIVNHKYKSGDWSVGDKALNAWWEWVAACMPLWLAPNAITLVGTAIMISTLAVGEAYRTGYYAWLTYPMLQMYTAASLFAYQTLDAVDGKQARRTQSSSPLGQLFDHGCDALVTNVFIINVLAALGLDPSTGLGFWSYASALTVFYLAQWEEGTCHVLRTNVHGMGVTEAQGTAMLLHVCAAFLPRDMFSAPLLPVPSFLQPWLQALDVLPMGAAGAVTIAQAAGATAVSVGIASSVMFVYHVAVTQRSPSALSSLLPTLLLVASALVDQAITAGEVRAYGGSKGASGPSAMLLAYAIAQTHMTTQTIVCSMARQPVSPVSEQVSILAYPPVVWLSWYMGGHAHPQVRYLQWAYAGLTVALYLQFAMNASYQIKRALGIHVFVLGRVMATPPRAAGAQPQREGQPTAQSTQEEASAKTPGRGRVQAPASSPASSRKRGSSSKAGATSKSPSRTRGHAK